MDPFIASLVGALAAGAVAAAKDTATEAVKDAYAGIRRYIKDHYAKVRLDDLEEEPELPEQKTVVQKQLEKAGAQNDQTLPKLVEQLVAAIKAEAPEAAKSAGVDLEQICAAIDVQVRRVDDGGPVRIRDIEARGGSVTIEDVGNQRKN